MLQGFAAVVSAPARTLGDSGFLFLNNYVRGVTMPERAGFQIELQLPSGPMRIPQQSIALPSGTYGIWPVNLAMPGMTLRYSTAQLFKRVQTGKQTNYFFFTIHGIVPEFYLDARVKVLGSTAPVVQQRDAHGLRLRVRPDASTLIRFSNGVHLIVLPEETAQNVWRTDDPSLLVASKSSFLHQAMESF